MKQVVSKRVYYRIREFYDNAMLKYPNTYFPDNAEIDTNKVLMELVKVGKSRLLKKNNSIIREWSGYLVDYSKTTGWYFAYRIENEIIYIDDAENFRNMNELI